VLRGRPVWGALALALALAACGAQPAPPRAVPWQLVSANGRALRLQVRVGGPPCDAVRGVRVDEGPRTVVVTVRAGSAPGAKCGPGVAAVIATFPVTVRLHAPLGSRTLRDGSA
jgi:hypothetical protein